MHITEHHTVQCPQCGGDQFETLETIRESDWVTCVTCTQSFPLDDIREAGIEQAKAVVIPEIKAEVEKIFKDIFKGKFK